MRTLAAPIIDAWSNGGPFIGDAKVHGRVTVEPGWWLQAIEVPGMRGTQRHWLIPASEELEIPNIKTIEIDRSIDTDAASCDISLYNNKMDVNGVLGVDLATLGDPGHFTWTRGNSDARARWGNRTDEPWIPVDGVVEESPYAGMTRVRVLSQDRYWAMEVQLEGMGVGFISHSDPFEEDWYFDYEPPPLWRDMLVPNALLRTYQGYGGEEKSLAECLADGNLVMTGVWLVDEVTAGTNGMLAIKCRDLSKLLVDQPLYPPLVPHSVYPHLEYHRWDYPLTQPPEGAALEPPYESKNGGAVAVSSYAPENHYSLVFDGNLATYWRSAGTTDPAGHEWIEFTNLGLINELGIIPWAGNYNVHVSLWRRDPNTWVEAWVPAGDGGGTIDGIPYVTQQGLGWEGNNNIHLPQLYDNVTKIRLTFANLQPGDDGEFYCGVRDFQSREMPSPEGTGRVPGNYTDLAEIIKEILCWAGFYGGSVGHPATGPLGYIESTGWAPDEPIEEDKFDKQKVMDAINMLKELVGYIFWVDEEGNPHFESPNWWGLGNFTDAGLHTEDLFEIDERLQLTEYAAKFADRAQLSAIVVATADPADHLLDTRSYTLELGHGLLLPDGVNMMKGIVKPTTILMPVDAEEIDMRIMAKLVAMHLYFQRRIGQVTAWANPAIQINDQVRIWERQTSETFTHYVRGMNTSMDLDAGTYTMTLETHWLGDPDDWGIGSAVNDPDILTYLGRTPSRSTKVSIDEPVGQPQNVVYV